MDKENDYYYHRHRGGLGALIIIFVGVIFLLNNLGILSWRVWNTIWRFWPLFLILAGLQLIIGKSRFANLAMLIVGLIFIVMVLFYAALVDNSILGTWLNSAFPWLPPVHTQMMDPYQSFNSTNPWD